MVRIPFRAAILSTCCGSQQESLGHWLAYRLVRFVPGILIAVTQSQSGRILQEKIFCSCRDPNSGNSSLCISHCADCVKAN